MNLKCKDVIDIIKELAPEEIAYDGDNVGLIIGDENREVKKVLTALELTDSVLQEAVEKGCNLILAHHPAIFKPVHAVNMNSPLGRRIIKAIENGITIYSAHTNLDLANGGTNDALFEKLRLNNKTFLKEEVAGMYGMGRVGELVKPIQLKEFAAHVKKALGLQYIHYTGEPDKIVQKVAICTGAGATHEYYQCAVKSGCDVYVTGDIKYHEAMAASEEGLALIDATHYATEIIIAEFLKGYIENKLRMEGSRIDIFAAVSGVNPFHYA